MARQYNRFQDAPRVQEWCPEFSAFTGAKQPGELRNVTRTHVDGTERYSRPRSIMAFTAKSSALGCATCRADGA
jgi:hypothetical protein